MVQFKGNYVIIYNSPLVKPYLKATGASDEVVKEILESRSIAEIDEKDGTWTISILMNGKKTTAVFRLGEPYEEPLPQGYSFTTVTTLENGDTLVSKSVHSNGTKGTRIYTFREDGITSTVFFGNSAKATRIYERL